MTVSIGLATAPEGTEDSMTLVGAADAMLYKAKQSGRNRIVMASTI